MKHWLLLILIVPAFSISLPRQSSEQMREDLIIYRKRVDKELNKINITQREETAYIIEHFATAMRPIMTIGGVQAEAIFLNLQEIYQPSNSSNSTSLHRLITQKCAVFIHNLRSIYKDKSVSV